MKGLRVVELVAGCSELGLGLAGAVPGMILADLGADVTRVVGPAAPVDEQVSWGQAWNRGKRIVTEWDGTGADVVLAYGPEELVEGRGFGWADLGPDVVHVRCRPSRTATGGTADYGLLVEARAGFTTQLRGHREGPIFMDLRASASGTAFLMTAAALALLRKGGGWAETSLYDGLLATLGCAIGRSARAAPEIESYWEQGSTFPTFLYRCSDGEFVQIWFGGKGMYATLLDILGDAPSTEGYYTDQSTGALNARAERWRETFATQPRAEWIRRLRERGIACEPVNHPGQALADPHLAEVGLARADGDVVRVNTPVTLRPAGPAAARAATGANLLSGVRVVDFSAFVAGPLAAQVLADLGADVVKVEPPGGEAMRAAAYAVAACQRGKRSLAIDITAPEAKPVVEELLRGADVVLHNFRVGVAERLGIDAATVAALNPGAIHCHASAFGPHGPRAKLPGNDALMQAVTGFELANGGAGNDPMAATWIPIDISGGWVAAIGILAGLYERSRSGQGQVVETSLLGAGMLLQAGTFLRDGELVSGPQLDAGQTGYGAGYRLYRGGDGAWFALVIPTPAAWDAVFALAAGDGDTPPRPAYRPLRRDAGDAEATAAERELESRFATRQAAEWLPLLQKAGALVEAVEPTTRDRFRRGVLDDPVNRQLRRVAAYDTADWGTLEQVGNLLRWGPGAPADGPSGLPGIGEHSVEVLRELGLPEKQIDDLLAAKTVTQG